MKKIQNYQKSDSNQIGRNKILNSIDNVQINLFDLNKKRIQRLNELKSEYNKASSIIASFQSVIENLEKQLSSLFEEMKKTMQDSYLNIQNFYEQELQNLQILKQSNSQQMPFEKLYEIKNYLDICQSQTLQQKLKQLFGEKFVPLIEKFKVQYNIFNKEFTKIAIQSQRQLNVRFQLDTLQPKQRGRQIKITRQDSLKKIKSDSNKISNQQQNSQISNKYSHKLGALLNLSNKKQKKILSNAQSISQDQLLTSQATFQSNQKTISDFNVKNQCQFCKQSYGKTSCIMLNCNHCLCYKCLKTLIKYQLKSDYFLQQGIITCKCQMKIQLSLLKNSAVGRFDILNRVFEQQLKILKQKSINFFQFCCKKGCSFFWVNNKNQCQDCKCGICCTQN